jgi:hypothetical protein
MTTPTAPNTHGFLVNSPKIFPNIAAATPRAAYIAARPKT